VLGNDLVSQVHYISISSCPRRHVSRRRGDLKDELSKLLGDQARVFVTRCVMHELRGLGAEFADTRHACKRHALHSCGHDAPVSASECLASQVSNGNAEHFFVATQDKTLQRKVNASQGGAVIFASPNGIHLEAPSELQKRLVHRKEQRQLGTTTVDRMSKSLADLKQEELAERPRERSIFKRNRAKGPNPLSRQSKKKKIAGEGVIGIENGDKKTGIAGEGERSGGQPQKRKRKRMRHKGHSDDNGNDVSNII
jgi:U3 small nucleolar RNA-associated protein 23